MCSFGLNSLENYIQTSSNNWVWMLKNQVQVRSYKVSIRMSKNHIRNLDPNPDIGHPCLGVGLAKVSDL